MTVMTALFAVLVGGVHHALDGRNSASVFLRQPSFPKPGLFLFTVETLSTRACVRMAEFLHNPFVFINIEIRWRGISITRDCMLKI